MSRTVTTTCVTGLQVGDTISFSTPSRLARLRLAFTRPRRWVVTSVGQTTMTVEERRLSWVEWRCEVVAAARDALSLAGVFSLRHFR